MNPLFEKRAAEPNVPLRSQTPVNNQTAPNPMAAPSLQNPHESLAVEEQPQQEKHTVPPELPNALFHMAKKADVEYEDDEWDEESMEDLKKEALLGCSLLGHDMGIWNAVNRHIQESVCLGCKAYVQVNTNPYPHDVAIGGDALVLQCNKPLKNFEGDEIPTFPDEDINYLKKMNIKAKLAWSWGGWKRISLHTVQSDDKRFTITEIDPTRRNNWFLLKDIETGKLYEQFTKTEAKQLAKRIREKSEEAVSGHAPSTQPVMAGVKPTGYGMNSNQETVRDEYKKLRRKYVYLAGKPRTPDVVAKLDEVIAEMSAYQKKHHWLK